MMNNKEITSLLKSDPRARRVFKGVFPRDRLTDNNNNNKNNNNDPAAYQHGSQ